MPLLPVWLLLKKMATVLFMLASTAIHLATGSMINIALRKPATMSSEKPGFSASTAVDGYTVAAPYGSQTVIDTTQGKHFAWWKVDLQREVQDATVRIYFRTDYTRARNGVKLYTSTSSFPDSNPTSQGQLCHTVTGDPSGRDIPDVYSVTCPGRWRYLLLYTDTNNDIRGPVLDFGEVEVHVCSAGTYGENCTNTCSSRRDGICPDGCQSRWTGVDCTKCPAGTFGSDCTSCSTRHCQGESDCPADGTCSQGCQDGWAGNTCTQTCRAGNYGPGCSLTCGQCIGDNICNYVTGNCPGDCQAGWRGPQCQQECVSGQYGVNCAQRCGQCNGTCDQVLGHCPDGCLHGFCGRRCDVKLADPNDVNIAAVVTGTVLGSLLLVFLLVFVCLIRQGRLQWVKSSEDKKPGQVSRDCTEMSNIARQAADDSEHAHRSSHVYNNDYDVLDQEKMPGNKDYDVIQHKEYENA